jgi:hypothetical protein
MNYFKFLFKSFLRVIKEETTEDHKRNQYRTLKNNFNFNKTCHRRSNSILNLKNT